MAELGRIVTITGPTIEPLSLDEAKVHLRVTHSADDQLIEQLVQVAREWVESYSGAYLAQRTVDVYYDAPPTSPFELPLTPAQSLTSITAYSSTGSTSSVAGTLDAVSVPPRVFVESWPSDLRTYNAIVCRVVVGHASASAIPASYKQAMLLILGELYERREETTEDEPFSVAWSAKALLAMSRRLTGLR